MHADDLFRKVLWKDFKEDSAAEQQNNLMTTNAEDVDSSFLLIKTNWIVYKLAIIN